MSEPPAGTRVAAAASTDGGESWSAQDNEETWKVVDAVLAIAEDTGKTSAQVALRWLLQRPGVTAPIIGVRTLAHLRDNLGATDWSLTDEQMHRLTVASDHPCHIRTSCRSAHSAVVSAELLAISPTIRASAEFMS